MKVKDIKQNHNNPRVIKDDKFHKLVHSIKEFPQMMELRPIIINDENIVLGGNMRLAALKELGYKDIPDEWVKKASDLTPEQEKEFIIKDNVGYGTWDYDVLANEWDVDILVNWNVEIPNYNVNFTPNINPDIKYTNITQEEIQKEEERLAKQMSGITKQRECICPNCGTEFSIDG